MPDREQDERGTDDESMGGSAEESEDNPGVPGGDDPQTGNPANAGDEEEDG